MLKMPVSEFQHIQQCIGFSLNDYWYDCILSFFKYRFRLTIKEEKVKVDAGQCYTILLYATSL